MDISTYSAADYALLVEGIPAHVEDRDKVKAWFEQRFGKVIDVSLCYNDGELFEQYLQKFDLNQQLISAKKQYQIATTKKQMNKTAKAVKKLTAKLDKMKNYLEK